MPNSLDGNWEKELARLVFKELKKGRPNWDLPHTKAVVFWGKELVDSMSLTKTEEKILIASAYLHDIGYSRTGVSADIKSVYSAKDAHMVVGAEMAKAILEKIEFDKDEIMQTVELVRYHDDLGRKRSSLMQLLIEADTLAQLDRKRVKPNFNYQDYYRWITEVFPKERSRVFESKKGKKLYRSMYIDARNYKF